MASCDQIKGFSPAVAGWNVIFNLIAGMFAFACVFPFLFVMIISFTDEKTLARNGYPLFPEKWSPEAYQLPVQERATSCCAPTA